jgi:hypothetical protein
MEGDVPRRYRRGAVLAYAARQLLMLTLVLPVAVLGYALWFVPLKLCTWAVPRFRPDLDQIATYKVATAMVAFPAWLFLVVALTWFLAGVRLGLAALLTLPLAGMATIAWRDRQAAVREDVRVFRRAGRLQRGRDRLAEQRRDLVAEFDGLIGDWAAHEDAARQGAASLGPPSPKP